jgi:uncharacterized membrane protein
MYNPQQQQMNAHRDRKHKEHMVILGVVLVIILITMVSLPLVLTPALAVGSSNAAGAETGTAAIARNTIGDMLFGCTIL